MAILTDITEQLEKLDEKIIELLTERARLVKSAGGLDGDQELDLLSFWLEEAADAGLDEDKVEKIARLVTALSRPTGEED